MTNFVKVSRIPGIWEIEAECETCDGAGTVSGEVAVIDYDHGGYLKEALADCPDCHGHGLRELTEEEQEKVDAMSTLQ